MNLSMKSRSSFPAIRKSLIRAALFRLFACALFSAGCAQVQETEPLPADHRFPLTLGEQSIHVELAVTQEESARGLMFRDELDENHGMLFVFRFPRQARFHMTNTSIPLDIGFFAPNGILREIYPLYPHDESTISSQSSQIQFALEMNQGWFSSNQVRRGAELDLEEIASALEQRGFSPSDFGL